MNKKSVFSLFVFMAVFTASTVTAKYAHAEHKPYVPSGDSSDDDDDSDGDGSSKGSSTTVEDEHHKKGDSDDKSDAATNHTLDSWGFDMAARAAQNPASGSLDGGVVGASVRNENIAASGHFVLYPQEGIGFDINMPRAEYLYKSKNGRRRLGLGVAGYARGTTTDSGDNGAFTARAFVSPQAALKGGKLLVGVDVSPLVMSCSAEAMKNDDANICDFGFVGAGMGPYVRIATGRFDALAGITAARAYSSKYQVGDLLTGEIDAQYMLDDDAEGGIAFYANAKVDQYQVNKNAEGVSNAQGQIILGNDSDATRTAVEATAGVRYIFKNGDGDKDKKHGAKKNE